MATMNGHTFPPAALREAADPAAPDAPPHQHTDAPTHHSTPTSTVHYLRRARLLPVPFPPPPQGWPDGPAYMADQVAEDAAEWAANRAIDNLVARAQHINGLAQEADREDIDASLRRMREVYASAVEDAKYAEQQAAHEAVHSRCPPCNQDCAQGRECPVTWAARRDAWLAAAEPIERRRPWLWLVYAAAALSMVALSALWPMGWAVSFATGWAP